MIVRRVDHYEYVNASSELRNDRGAGTCRVAICRMARLQTHLRQHRRPLVFPWCGGFVSGRRAQNGGVVALPTNDLQANGEAIFGKPGRNAGGRLTGQVELIGEGDPLEWASLLALDRFRTLDALLERGARDGRRQQRS